MSYAPSGQSDYKKSVRVATTSNIDLSSPGSSIDGVTLASGDRVLVKNQSTGSQNGIYVFASSSTAMVRANDANSSGELSGGTLIPVEAGSTYADTLWIISTNGSITLGTTSIAFSQVTGSGGGGGSVIAADVSYAGSTNLVASNVEAALDELDSEKAAVSHSHVIGDITGLQTALDGKASSSHSHVVGDVTGLQAALDAKAGSSHTHSIGDVTGLQAALDGKQAALGTGDVTSTMILNGTIVNDDINASAGIALSKLATDPLSRSNHTGTQTLSTISDAGSAASKNTPASGNASATEVVLGSDTRLSDSRTPTTHTHDDRYYTESEADALLAAKLDALLMPAGMISPYAGTTAPTGWLLCDGSLISRTTYSSLFTAIGTSFGSGDGTTTFALPDLRGRVPVGLDDLNNTVGTGGGDAGRLDVANTIGGSGGSQKVTLTGANMPSHDHGGTITSGGTKADFNAAVTSDGNKADFNADVVSDGKKADFSSSVTIASSSGYNAWSGNTSSGSISFGSAGTNRLTPTVLTATATALDAAQALHTHTISQTTLDSSQANHSHQIAAANLNAAQANHTHSVTIASAYGNGGGGTDAHDNMQPYLLLGYIIKT